MESESSSLFVTCPYNKFHRVLRSRIQAHLIKCEKQYPKLEICPYNATHRYPEEEIKNHIHNCPAKLAMFPDISPTKVTTKQYLQKDYIKETDPDYEDWD